MLTAALGDAADCKARQRREQQRRDILIIGFTAGARRILVAIATMSPMA